MKFTVIIPARYASTRFPGKPLADIGGKPMVVRVAERARRSGADEVLIATDHAGIAAAAARYGFEAVMTRRNHASGTDRIAEVAAKRRYPADRIVVNVQGDEPLIEPALIRRVAASLARHRAAAMATACHPITRRARARQPERGESGAGPRRLRALLQPGADSVGARRLRARHLPHPGRAAGIPPPRHLRLPRGFLRAYTRLAPAAVERFEALEQLRALAHGYRIHCAVTRAAPHPGVDTPGRSPAPASPPREAMQER